MRDAIRLSFATPRRSRLSILALLLAGALLGPVAVAHAVPVASFTVSANPTAGAPVTLTSTSFDTDGRDVTLAWDTDGDGQFDNGTGESVAPTFATAGSHTVGLQATSLGGQDTATQIIDVAGQVPPPPNVPPSARFGFSPDSPVVGEQVTFDSSSTDSDGTIVAEQWDLDGDGDFNDAAGDQATRSFPTAGAHTVRLRVRDNGGDSDQTSHTVVVNAPPTASFTISAATAVVGDSVTFTSTSDDSDGSVVSHAWDLDGDGAFDDGAGSTVTRSYGTDGARVVRLRVRDDRGATAETSHVVTVVANRAPLASFTFQPAAPAAGQSILFDSTATDPDGSVTALAWDLDNDGRFDDASGDTARRTFTSAGVHRVRLRVTDDRGESTTAFQDVRVAAASAATATSTTSPVSSTAPGSGVAPVTAIGPPIQASRAALLNPFPVVRIRALVFRTSARISLLTVRAPRGARVRALCRGRGCRAGTTVRRVPANGVVRLRPLERRLQPGAVVEIFVTMPGRIGKYTRYTVRTGRTPLRRDLCVAAGAGQPPGRCPAD